MAAHLRESKPNSYEISAEIGKGAYGTVYKARDLKNNGQFVALKEIRIVSRTEEGMPMSTIREIGMLRQLEKYEHENIVRLLDVLPGRQSIHEMKLMLVFEHIDQDLAQYLEKCPSCGLGPDCIRDLMQQTMKGVDFLHSNRIVHRDLKPQNILVTSQGRVKIADFGLARIYAFSMALTTVVVTLYYRSPEVLLQDTYCTAVDIWSCGTIFAELYLRRPLFQGTSEIDQLRKIFHIMGLPTASEWPPTVSIPRESFAERVKQPLDKYIPNIDPAAKDVLNKMLSFNQKERISAAASLRHHYFTEEDPDMSTSSTYSSLSISTSCSFFNDLSSPFRDLATHPETPVSTGGMSLSSSDPAGPANIQASQQAEPDIVASSSNDSRVERLNPNRVPSQSSVVPDLLTSTGDGLYRVAQTNPLMCSENLPLDQSSPRVGNRSTLDHSYVSGCDSLETVTETAQDLRVSSGVSSFLTDNACRELPNGYHDNSVDGSDIKRGVKRSRPY